MNRFINKEYLVDITLHSLHTQAPTQPAKVKCELHFQDDSYLKFKSQTLKGGVAQFNAERLLFHFVAEVALVFKLVRNKNEHFLGQYTLNLEAMLANKQYRYRGKLKLEETEIWVDFECNIIDKQQVCDSDTEQPEPDTKPQAITKSTIASVQLSPRHHYNKPLSELNSPFVIMKKTAGSHIPLPPEQFAQLLQEAQDILNKRQFFNQRHHILQHYPRDKHGRLRTTNIESLESRLIESQKSNFNFNAALYITIGMIAFVLGLKL